MSEFVAVSREWLDSVIRAMNDRTSCPFCGSTAEPVVDPEDEMFYARKGCRDCDKWWTEPRLKERAARGEAGKESK